MHDECETLGLSHQVRLEADARPRRSRRALLPLETPFEPAFEPPIATSSEGSSEWEALRSCALSRVGIATIQRLRGAHLDAGPGRCLGRHRRGGLGFFRLAGGVVGRLAVALRHQLLDLRARLADSLPALGAHPVGQHLITRWDRRHRRLERPRRPVVRQGRDRHVIGRQPVELLAGERRRHLVGEVAHLGA